MEKINADETLLPNYTLDFRFIDTRGIPHLSNLIINYSPRRSLGRLLFHICKNFSILGVKAFMELWGKGATAFIGPEDSCQTEAMMAAAQNLPMVSFVRITILK